MAATCFALFSTLQMKRSAKPSNSRDSSVSAGGASISAVSASISAPSQSRRASMDGGYRIPADK